MNGVHDVHEIFIICFNEILQELSAFSLDHVCLQGDLIRFFISNNVLIEDFVLLIWSLPDDFSLNLRLLLLEVSLLRNHSSDFKYSHYGPHDFPKNFILIYELIAIFKWKLTISTHDVKNFFFVTQIVRHAKYLKGSNVPKVKSGPIPQLYVAIIRFVLLSYCFLLLFYTKLVHLCLLELPFFELQLSTRVSGLFQFFINGDAMHCVRLISEHVHELVLVK
jgi:hypothetical protein